MSSTNLKSPVGTKHQLIPLPFRAKEKETSLLQQAKRLNDQLSQQKYLLENTTEDLSSGDLTEVLPPLLPNFRSTEPGSLDILIGSIG